MLSIDINDLWAQVLAGVIAGIVLLLVQPGWIRRPDPRASSSASAGHRNSGGNQAVFEGNTVTGDLRVDQRYIDKSRSTTITNNINNANNASASDDDWIKLFLVVCVGIVSAALFLLFRPLLQGVAYGTALATVVMLTVAIVRTIRIRAWTGRAILVTVIAVGSIVVTLFTWAGIATLDRDGLSLDGIAADIAPLPVEHDARGASMYIDYFLHSVLPVVLDGERPVLGFVISLMLAAAASVALSAYAWLRLLDWHAFLRFAHAGQQRPKVVARAKSFTEGSGIGVIAGAALLAFVAIGCAYGGVYDLWQALPQQ